MHVTIFSSSVYLLPVIIILVELECWLTLFLSSTLVLTTAFQCLRQLLGNVFQQTLARRVCNHYSPSSAISLICQPTLANVLSLLCCAYELASFPGHSQILSHSCGEKSHFLHSCEIKSVSGLGTRLCKNCKSPNKSLGAGLELYLAITHCW